MLTHLVVFIYMFLTSYVMGRFITDRLVRSLFKDISNIHPALYCYTGLLYIMLLAGFFSFFAPIGFVFNLLLCILTIVFAILGNRSLLTGFAMQAGWPWKAAMAFLAFTLIFVLVKSSGPVTNPDTGGYHLPFVKWTEQYPVVKGIANVHSRFGFNYQYLVLCAVYGFSFLDIPTLHALNGFIMMLLVSYIVTTISFIRGQRLLWLDVVKLIVLFFVINMSNAMSSMSPDFPSSAFGLIAVLLMLDKATEGSFAQFDTKALLVFLIGIAAVLSKLSVAPVLLFNLVFLPSLFRHSRWLTACIAIGLISLIPYLLRNYLISGYLIYPLYSLDIFNVPWKVPLETAIFEKEIVKYYALGMPIGTKTDLAGMLRSWFAFMRISNPVYVYIIYVLVACIVLNVLLLIYITATKRLKRNLPFVIINSILVVSLLYWFQLGPDVRFGNGYIIPFIATTLAWLSYNIAKKMQGLVVYGAILVFMLFQVAMLKGSAVSKSYYNQSNAVSFSLVKQVPYIAPDTFSLRLPNGSTVYKTHNNSQCWDAALPCGFEKDNFKMIGNHFRDGFVYTADSMVNY